MVISMNQKVKLSKAISYFFIICAVLVFVAIWPANLIQSTFISKSDETSMIESQPVSVENNITQMFVGEGAELESIDLYVYNQMQGETITFRLYDSSYTEIFNQFYQVKNRDKTPGFINIPIGYELSNGVDYFYTIEGLSADMTVALEDYATSTSLVNGYMSYGGIEQPEYNVMARYHYRQPFVWWQIVLSGIMIAFTAAVLCFLAKVLFQKKLVDKEVVVHDVIRVVLSPVVIVVGFILLLMVFPGRRFGTGILNYGVYAGSVILFTCVLLWIINCKRTVEVSLPGIATIKSNFLEYLQVICWSCVVWYCYQYMNGLYEIHHTYATRRMLIWFILALVFTYSKEELLKLMHGIYLVVAGVAAYFYAKPYIGLEEAEEVYKLQAYLMVVGGLLIILLLTNVFGMIRKQITLKRKFAIPYTVFFAVLMTLMLVFRNGRSWETTMIVLFVVFYFRMFVWEYSDKMITIFCNGVILNFVYMVIYSLMHRPYHRYYFYRYGMGYHTVTMTSVYLTLVIAIVVVRLFEKYKKYQTLISVWGEVVLLAVANAYLFLTLSRIGYLASAFVEAVVIIVYACIQKEDKLKAFAKNTGIVIVSFCICFPIVFTMTRVVPAIVNDPVLTDIEKTGHHIEKGTPSNDIKYMDVEHFYNIMLYKLFNNNRGDFSSVEPSEWELDEDVFLKDMYLAVRSQLESKDIFVVNDSVRLVSAEEESVGDFNDATNGRIDIFRDYIAEWNLTGHDDMAIVMSDGTVGVHAHNVFLQFIHDHGLITGIVFILFGAVSLVLSVLRYVKHKDERYIYIGAILLAFASTGMAEWNFHLCNAFGLAIFVAMTPFIFRVRDSKEDE